MIIHLWRDLLHQHRLRENQPIPSSRQGTSSRHPHHQTDWKMQTNQEIVLVMMQVIPRSLKRVVVNHRYHRWNSSSKDWGKRGRSCNNLRWSMILVLMMSNKEHLQIHRWFHRIRNWKRGMKITLRSTSHRLYRNNKLRKLKKRSCKRRKKGYNHRKK